MQTSGKQRIQAQLHNTNDNGELLYFYNYQRNQQSFSSLPQGKIMQNLGLVCDRGSKLAQIDNIFISQDIIDFHLVGSGSYIFPLYLKNKGI